MRCKRISGSSDSFKERLETAVPVEEGWTNQVYETREGTIIKMFSRHPLEAVIFGLVDLARGRPNFPSWKERLHKEEEMKEVLEADGYPVPSVITKENHGLEMEKIDGREAGEIIRNSDPETALEIGQRIGETVLDLHKDGYSLGDTDFGNFYLREGEVYTIDHEYASSQADWFDKERDVVHIVWSALELDHESCTSFMEGFAETYRGVNGRELGAALFFSTISAVVTLNLRNIVSVWSNSFKIISG